MDVTTFGQAVLDMLKAEPGDALLVVAFTPDASAADLGGFLVGFPTGPGQLPVTVELAGVIYRLGKCQGVSWAQREYLDASPVVACWDDFSE